MARIEGGDRAYDGLRSAVVENGLLAVDRNDAGENGGACCPEFAVTTKYKLSGDKLIASGTPVRRELYPGEPLKFAKGASSATVKLTIAPEDRKRFTLGARAGQIMSVSVDNPKISIRLLEDALVTEGTNGFHRQAAQERHLHRGTLELRGNTGRGHIDGRYQMIIPPISASHSHVVNGVVNMVRIPSPARFNGLTKPQKGR